jgi:hypothetical protein
MDTLILLPCQICWHTPKIRVKKVIGSNYLKKYKKSSIHHKYACMSCFFLCFPAQASSFLFFQSSFFVPLFFQCKPRSHTLACSLQRTTDLFCLFFGPFVIDFNISNSTPAFGLVACFNNFFYLSFIYIFFYFLIYLLFHNFICILFPWLVIFAPLLVFHCI